MAPDTNGSMVGKRIGVFRVDAMLGAGGMGEVYRGHDTALGRDVAIKTLLPRFTSDPDRLARLKREARMLASLNHSNVASIYGLEESPERCALVLEFVDGETLAERLAPGPLSVAEALNIARQIARALDAAHQKGIVHRDLKPANIKITSAGVVKVLDFGLAKIAEDGSSPDVSTLATVGATRDGVILGTPAYMSPEQARGKLVDKRSDIWSFGCVLFEMLTGVSPFAADTFSDSIVLILGRDPDWSALPTGTSPLVRQLLQRCLEKDAAQRVRDIGDVLFDLESDQDHSGRSERLHQTSVNAAQTSAAEATRATSPAWTRVVGGAVLIGSTVAVALLAWFANRHFESVPEPAHQPTVKFTFTPERLRRGSITDIDAEVSVSPDGRHLTYVESNGGQLWVRDIDREQARPVPGATSVYQAFWSPDNRFIAYSSGPELRRISAEGGTPSTITNLTGQFRGGTWSADGLTIVYCDDAGMSTVPAAGGASTRIVEHRHIEQPSFLTLPDGRRAFLFQVLETPPEHELQYLIAGEQQRHTIIKARSSNPYPAYSPTGHILYVDGFGTASTIWALPFSLAELKAVGKPFPVAEHGSSPKLAVTGMLVYSDLPSDKLNLIWTDRTGKTLSTVGVPQLYDAPALSPSGRKLVVAVRDGQGWDLWTQEIDQANLTRFTFDSVAVRTPAWSPSGDAIIWSRSAATGSGIYSKTTSGEGSAQAIITADRVLAPAWSADRRFLAYEVRSLATNGDVWYRERSSNGQLGEPAPFAQSRFNEGSPTFSPDAHFLAYVSDETGRNEIYVRNFPNGDGKWRVSTSGGTAPRWRRDGQELFYVEGDQLIAVAVTTRPTFASKAATPLFSNRMLAAFNPEYDVTADGKRFIARDTPPDERPLAVHVVHNWFEEFRSPR